MTPPQVASQHPAAADTRRELLLAAAREMHRHGFQAASLARILAATGVTKGALYHHFPSKLALGYAVCDECYAPMLRRTWIEPLQGVDVNALKVLTEIIRAVGARMAAEDIRLGCPVNNLAQEMSPVDAGFRTRIEALFREWRNAIADAFRQSARLGRLRSDVDPDAAACFVVASLEGCVGMAKNAQSREILACCGDGLIDYLESLRPGEQNGSSISHA